jgi:hypothetical protein
MLGDDPDVWTPTIEGTDPCARAPVPGATLPLIRSGTGFRRRPAVS